MRGESEAQAELMHQFSVTLAAGSEGGISDAKASASQSGSTPGAPSAGDEASEMDKP